MLLREIDSLKEQLAEAKSAVAFRAPELEDKPEPVAEPSVARRQLSRNSASAKQPMWVWVLPTSTASSIGQRLGGRRRPRHDVDNRIQRVRQQGMHAFLVEWSEFDGGDR